MSANPWATSVRFGLLVAVGVLSCVSSLQAQMMVAADQSVDPGKLSEVRRGELANFFTRWTNFDDSPAPVQNRIGSIAIDHGQHYFYCSGLDGSVFEYDGRDELLLARTAGQVRHVAFDRASNILYYSTLETPQDGAPLADGGIYGIDLNTRRQVKAIRVVQADLEGGFWGAIAADKGRLYLATESMVYSYERGGWKGVLRGGPEPIRGLAVSPWGQLHYVDGAQGVYAFEKDGSTTRVHQLATTTLTHIGWFPAPAAEPAPARSGIGVPAVRVGTPMPGPYANPPEEGVKIGDSGGQQPGTVTVGRPGGRPLGAYQPRPRPGTVMVTAPATSSIQGSVLGLSAQQIARIRVSVLSADRTIIRQATLSRNGFFMVDRLPPGTYTVFVADPNGRTQFANSTQTVTLAPMTSQQIAFQAR